MTQQPNRPAEVFAELRQQFEQWRSTQPLRSKLPESLWQSAAKLAKEHGVNPTARALGLDYSGLRKRVIGSPNQRNTATAATAFVELVTPPSAKPEECVIEFESAKGLKMRIVWKTATPPDWSSLLRAWRDAER